MLQEVRNFVVTSVRNVLSFKSALMVLAVALFVSIGQSAFAQSVPIPVEIPDLDYGGVVTTVLGKIAIICAAAIGLGLSFHCIRVLYRMFRGMAK